MLQQQLVIVKQLEDSFVRHEVAVVVRLHLLGEEVINPLCYIVLVNGVVADTVTQAAVHQSTDLGYWVFVREVFNLPHSALGFSRTLERIDKHVNEQVNQAALSHQLLTLRVRSAISTDRIEQLVLLVDNKEDDLAEQ